ncbi:ABC transporter ATP-binding protein [Nakamurella deserti]|uniref:ABC transporter ATP-binding protein n=1 Tax=Nakamurella deserti TaxID=2164074 RepID=UPI001F0BEC7C|nr:ABC transporter ATP-binding protein [Nakamurella deserti]
MSSPVVPAPGDAVVLDDVSRVFRRRAAPFRAPSETRALDHVSLTVPRRSRFGIVGESGSGKTTLVRLVAALDRPTDGTVTVDGTDITALPESGLRPLRRRLQLVFQDPMGSLDPRMRIGDIVAEPLHAQGASGVDGRVREVLAEVGLDDGVLRRYPHQFSGGQRQRISIARAIAPRPSILLADEAVSALDVSSRGQVLELLDRLAATEDFTLIFVSHDLSVIRRVCDRVAVLRQGQVVETGTTAQVYADPQHPYTRELLAAVPTLDRGLAAARRRHQP